VAKFARGIHRACRLHDGTLQKLRGNIGIHTLSCRSDALLLVADHAVPLGLLINELVANAIKYAYPDGSGAIEVSAREIDGSLHVEVSDQGKGLPQGFDIDEPRASLGFKVITGMVRQLRGHLTVDNDRKGSRFLLELPIILRSDRSPSACPERHGRMGSRGRILELDNLDCKASKRTSASHAPQIFLTRFGGGQVIVSEQSAGGQRSSFMWVRPTYSRRRPR
jgi:hypothetical protein